MHGSYKSVSDGERYVIIVLVVSLVLRGEATTTHTNLHSSSFTKALDVRIQFCSNCTPIRHPNLRAV